LLHDILTGTSLASFKQTSAAKNCTAIISTSGAQGGLMLAVQPDKSLLNVYSFQKDQVSLKVVLPERLSCIAVDRRGQFCAAGTAQGRIYVWEVRPRQYLGTYAHTLRFCHCHRLRLE
jgi:pre-rRNA-processing protein IPI3